MTKTKFTIVFLSAVDNPFLGRITLAFRKVGLEPDVVLLDEGRPCGAKERDIWTERTAGRLPPLPLASLPGGSPACRFVSSHAAADTIAKLKEMDVDLVVSASTPRILPPEVLAASGRGLLAVHPGLIPDYRGCTCVEWAIFNDDKVGNSAFFMTPGIDAGPVILSESLTFTAADGYTDVRIRVYEHGIDLLARAALRVRDENLRCKDMALPAEGRYYPVIDPDSMEAVHRKLQNGQYAYQY